MSRLYSLALLGISTSAFGQHIATVDGYTFFNTGKRLYMPVREASRALDWPLRSQGGKLVFHGHPVPSAMLRNAFTGEKLVAVSWLKSAGAIVNAKREGATVKDARRRGKAFYVRRGAKRVFVNKSRLMLAAYQGQRLVLRSAISIGREGHETPTGLFRATYRERTHRSKLYGNVPLPYAVHLVGNIFIHGFEDAHGRGSYGCIRLPNTGANAARWFYFWIDTGTSVSILGKWPKGAK